LGNYCRELLDIIDRMQYLAMVIGINIVLALSTIAKKNKTKMARVIEADKMSPIGGSPNGFF
jgi:hypothetical protein